MPCGARDVSVLGSHAGQFADRKSARCGPMTRPDLIDLLRQNYIAYFRLFHGQHGVCVHEDEQAAWIIANGPPGNHILRSNFPSDNVEEGIDALLADIGARTEACRWLCFPGDLPHDLGYRLVSRGLDAGEGDFWMFRPLDELPRRACPDGLRVTSVSTGPGLRSWWTASARGFGTSQRAAQLWYDAYRRHASEQAHTPALQRSCRPRSGYVGHSHSGRRHRRNLRYLHAPGLSRQRVRFRPRESHHGRSPYSRLRLRRPPDGE